MCFLLEVEESTLCTLPKLLMYQVEEVPPFTIAGVDFAGPLLVKMERAAVCTNYDLDLPIYLFYYQGSSCRGCPECDNPIISALFQKDLPEEEDYNAEWYQTMVKHLSERLKLSDGL